MNAKTLKALRESIAHWDRLRKGKQRSDEDLDSDSCPLCRLFAHDKPKDICCKACPVFARTGRRYCEGTPYWKAAITFSGRSGTAFKRAATQEYKFLISLLPPGEKP